MQPGETPEQYRERRLRELGEPLSVTVTEGQRPIPWVFLAVVALGLALATR